MSLLVFALVALRIMAGMAQADAPSRMNVLFIVFDDLTNNALGTYDGPQATPTVRRTGARPPQTSRSQAE
jgi:hypothetical protein